MSGPLSRVELSDEQLREAWEQLLTTHTHWPTDFRQAMLHPLVSRVLRIEAALRIRSAPVSAKPGPVPAQALRPRWRPYGNTTKPASDRKRAAAADLDD